MSSRASCQSKGIGSPQIPDRLSPRITGTSLAETRRCGQSRPPNLLGGRNVIPFAGPVFWLRRILPVLVEITVKPPVCPVRTVDCMNDDRQRPIEPNRILRPPFSRARPVPAHDNRDARDQPVPRN